MSEQRSFWTELQRRHVVRAAVAHVVFFWLLAQIAETVFPYIGVVEEPVRWAVVAGVALFPATLIIAWFFEHPWHRFTGSRMVLDLVVIVVIAVGAVSWVVRNIPQVAYNRTSIAVLPFRFSPDAPLEQGLSRALAIEINSLLMKSKSIDVIGYESANSPLLSGLDLEAIAGRLGVEYLVAGTVSLSSQSMDLNVNLHDHRGISVWSSKIHENIDQLFTVQELIAAEIASRLGVGEDRIPVAKIAAERCPMPTNPAALEKYYTARHYVGMRNGTPESNRQLAEAVKNYEFLIEQYPDFAEAKSGLAWALYHQRNYDRNANREENARRLEEAAARALEQCETIGEALFFVPNQYDHENYWIKSHQQMIAAAEMEPSRSENFQKLDRNYAEAGLIRKAIEGAEKDYHLNPLSVRSIKQLAALYTGQGLLEEADTLWKLSIELGSNSENFAAEAMEWRDCEVDLQCLGDLTFPEDHVARDQIIAIWTRPADDEQAAIKNADFVALAREIPQWVNYYVSFACQFDHLTPAFFQFYEIAQETGNYWYWPNVWAPDCENLWSAAEFPAFVESAGLVEYWREVGWPETCGPVGDDFACGVRQGE